MNGFLPTTKKEMNTLGWDQADFVLVSGDAYVDHASFGAAVIGRVLEKMGYRVAILDQPEWKHCQDFQRFGQPRLAFLITSGNIDSMINHYTVAKKKRSRELYSPGGETGKRPDRATIVYSQRARQAYPDTPIILGGMEASLRRFAHYDYWSDRVRRSILVDAKADLLVFGMGEKIIMEIADNLDNGLDINYIHHIPGTCYLVHSEDEVYDAVKLPAYEEVITDKIAFNKAFQLSYEEQDPIRGKTLIQQHGTRYLVQNPPMLPANENELDWVFSLPFQREIHPKYQKQGIPAYEEIRFSLTSNRGCYGNCSFCSLAFHQGRIVQSRSHESIVEEAKEMIGDPQFKGYIHDVGGPTANFRRPACDRQLKVGACKKKQCLFPKPCKEMVVDHTDYLSLLRKLRHLRGVKKVFVRSGIRYDYVLADQKTNFLKELSEHHISGQLRIAPEHISERVLKQMGKPGKDVYLQFMKEFEKVNKELGMDQYMVPYLMSSHPGSTLKDAVALAEFLRDIHHQPEQVQDFYPTPGTRSTAIYYTELDPSNGNPVYVPKTPEEKAMQRALMQYRNPRNARLVRKALHLAHREDLIGTGHHALVKPEREHSNTHTNQSPQRSDQKRTSRKRKRS
ncbi:YgiQ family radical SAM protein [Gottschalkiaceae bacterium SANA]|nr:YgiQ family radical SAM protein [Gottschalkiaceae bacterium SANA]